MDLYFDKLLEFLLNSLDPERRYPMIVLGYEMNTDFSRLDSVSAGGSCSLMSNKEIEIEFESIYKFR